MTSGRWFVRSQSTESSALRAILRVSRGGSSFESERCIAIRDRFAHRFHQFRIITARNTVHLDKNRRYQ